MKLILIRLLIGLLKAIQHLRTNSKTDNRILIPAYTGLGNFIMMTPMIRALREVHPSSKIYILAGNDFGTEFVLEGSGIVDQTFILREDASLMRKFLFFWRLRQERIDIAFIPFNASPSFYRFGVVLAGIPRRVGHTLEALRKPMGWTHDALTDTVPVRVGRHETDLHFDLLQIVEPTVQRSYRTVVNAHDDDAVLAKFGLDKKHYIAAQISAANGNLSPKVWPLENFHSLFKRLHAEGWSIVLLGDTTEQEKVGLFAKESAVRVIDISGRTSIQEVATVIRHAAVLVCHDSGLMHIGNTLGTPLVALYGPTDYLYTLPKAKTSAIIRKNLPCAPCMANFAKTEAEAYRDCPIQFECMRKISVDEVFDTVMKQLIKNVNLS